MVLIIMALTLAIIVKKRGGRLYFWVPVFLVGCVILMDKGPNTLVASLTINLLWWMSWLGTFLFFSNRRRSDAEGINHQGQGQVPDSGSEL